MSRLKGISQMIEKPVGGYFVKSDLCTYTYIGMQYTSPPPGKWALPVLNLNNCDSSPFHATKYFLLPKDSAHWPLLHNVFREVHSTKNLVRRQAKHPGAY